MEEASSSLGEVKEDGILPSSDEDGDGDDDDGGDLNMRERKNRKRGDGAVAAHDLINELHEDVIKRILSFEDPRDRAAISLVCRNLYRIDAETRKHVTIAFCYSIDPSRLRRRFPNLESVKIKGKPRASMFYNLIPEDWGGYAAPWALEFAARDFVCLNSVHFRRMIVKDDDVAVMVQARGHMLRSLKFDKCSGFSTDALHMIARRCRYLETLFLEESIISENDSEWLHEVAINNSLLETLNFHMTELTISWEDVELIAKNCRSLISLKCSECDVSELVGFFRAAIALEEFSGGSFNHEVDPVKYESSVWFPPRLCRLGLSFMGTNVMHTIFPFVAALKKLDLQFAFLSTEDHCQLIQQCPNLEVLEAREVIGDRGLEVVAQTCRRLKRLRIERGEDEQGLEDEHGMVSHRGLSAVAQGCRELEHIAVYVSDITNSALEAIGNLCKNMCDFRLVLLERMERIADLPLDNGVKALLRGCTKLTRFALYLRPHGLTDIGLGYIAQYSGGIKYMLLGCVGESDDGLMRFSRGCFNLQKLELRGCCFSKRALALAVMELASLRYIWVEGYEESPDGNDLMAMIRPFWNIEFIRPAQILAYYSLAGQRTDFPPSVTPLLLPA